MKLAMIALLVHPIMILFPTGYFAASDWGTKAENNPGATDSPRSCTSSRRLLRITVQPLTGSAPLAGLISNPNPAPEFVPVGHCDSLGHDIQSVSADHRSHRDGREPRSKEIFSVRFRDLAR